MRAILHLQDTFRNQEDHNQMGRPKKKIEPELLSPDEEIPSAKPITRLVDAEHTIKYREPVPVPVPESDESDAEIWEDDDEERQRRRPHKTIREKLQEKLSKAKITGGDQLYLRIDRMPNYDPTTGSLDGMGGDKEFCWRGTCTIEYITDDSYLADTAKRHGAGNYWFTLRQGKIIVAAWQHRIGGNPQLATQGIDTMTGQSQVIYQPMPQMNGQQQSATISTTKTLKEVAEIIEVVDRIRGDREPIPYQPPQPVEPQLPPKVALLSAIAEHPDLVENVMEKLTGSRGKSSEPSTTELILKYGEGIINALSVGVQNVIKTVTSELKEIRQIQNGNHVEDQMATPQNANHQPETSRTTSTFQNAISQGQQESTQSTQEDIVPNQGQSPEEALLALVCDNCSRNIPPKITASRINEFADMVAQQAPHLSVDGWIEMFTEMEVDTVINYAGEGIFGEQGKTLAGLTHSHKWIGELREILKQQEGDDR